jgi:hypothetical protein
VGIHFIGSGAGEERVQWRGAAGSYGAFMAFNAAVSVGEAIGQHHFFGRGRVEAVPTARFPGLGGSGSRSSMQPASGGSAACLGACLEEEERPSGPAASEGRKRKMGGPAMDVWPNATRLTGKEKKHFLNFLATKQICFKRKFCI